MAPIRRVFGLLSYKSACVTRRIGTEGRAVGGDFFTEVTGRIPFGGLDSSDPLTFKVYEPDRLVLGKSMAEHLRIGELLQRARCGPRL